MPILPGRSLLPLCRGEDVPGWRDCIYSESYNFVAESHPGQWARTVRNERYRYTMYPDGYGEQLFALTSDPDETSNLAGDPGHAAVRAELRDRLLELVIMQDYPKTRRELWGFGVH